MFLYCLFDMVANTFYSPTCFKNDAVAKRSFGELMLSERYSSTKSDYQLVKVGSFCEDSGVIVPETVPTIVIKGCDF